MNLFVGNLNPETTVATLRPLFEPFGEIVSAKIIMDNATGTSRGFGFVEMADKFQAFDAIDNIDATFFEGNIISVKEAKQNNARGGSSSGGGNRSFNRPRTPRPGSFNREGGGYNRDNSGGYNRDRDNGGGFNRDRGSYNRDNTGGYNRDNTGGYNRDNSGGYNRDSSYGNRNSGNNNSSSSNDDDRFNRL